MQRKRHKAKINMIHQEISGFLNFSCCVHVLGRSQTTLTREGGHTERFDSKFSHICKTNTRFGLLYERRPRVNIGVKYSGN